MTSLTRRSGSRRGLVAQVLLPLVVTLLPLAAMMFYRSHQRVKWVQRAQHQIRAQALLRCAEGQVVELVAAGRHTATERKVLPEGSLEIALTPSGNGPGGQPIVRWKAVASHLGEEVRAEGYAEVATVRSQPSVLLRDASFRDPAPPGGPAVDRVAAFLAQARAEAGMSTTQFVNVMRDQCHRLGSPDVDAALPGIARALETAKIQAPPVPGPAKPPLVVQYMDQNQQRLDHRKAGRNEEAARVEAAFVATYRTYLLTDGAAGAFAAAPLVPPASPGPDASPLPPADPGPAGPPGDRADPVGPLFTAHGAINPSSGKATVPIFLLGKPDASPQPAPPSPSAAPP